MVEQPARVAGVLGLKFEDLPRERLQLAEACLSAGNRQGRKILPRSFFRHQQVCGSQTYMQTNHPHT